VNPIRALQMRSAAIVPSGPFTMASLFVAAEKGAYYDFTDGTKLAVNADGSGGSPSVGSMVRWAVDQSPNGNHLRNTTGTVPTRRANGVETTGTGYGLFNMAGFGNWPAFSQPAEMIVCLEQKTFTATDNYIVSCGTCRFVEGTSSGKVRFLDGNYSAEFTPGLNAEYMAHAVFNGAQSQFGFNGGALTSTATLNGGLSEMTIGSGTGGGGVTAVRVKRLLVINRLLTMAERAGAYAWATA
jgi:hypothetical protein